MARLVVISNRVAVPDSEGKLPPGGLAVAVDAAMREREGVWFGWSGKVSENPPPLTHNMVGKVDYVVTDLRPNDFQEYYNGFANRSLWPLLHYRTDLAEYQSIDYQGYRRVNEFFADRLVSILEDDDIIWVHDYHLMPFARALRQRGVRNRIGFFLHIPLPPPDLLKTLPKHHSVIGTLADYDLVGFQTESDAANFARYITGVTGASTQDGRTYRLGDHSFRIGVFPVGVEPDLFREEAERAAESTFISELDDSLRDRLLVLGIDRLDYSKGIMQRIEAFERFLERVTDWRGKVTYLQIAPKSREDIPEYTEMYEEVNRAIGEVNGRYGDVGWVPVRYVNRNYQRSSVAGMLRHARVGLVTPLRDGMNLVAKEFVAAQDPENPGVLILSEFAGAAAELQAALLVNPHDRDAMADAITQALYMPLDERQARYHEMFATLEANDIRYWARSFLDALTRPGRATNWLSNWGVTGR